MALRPQQEAFLIAFGLLGNVTEAADKARIGRRTHYDWLDADSEYAAAFKQAKEDYCDQIRAEIRRRVFEGIPEPVIYQGQVQFDVCRDKDTGEILYNDDGIPIVSDRPLVVYKKDSQILMFEAKKHIPEYRERFEHEHTGPGGGPLALTVEFVRPKAA